MGELVRLIAHRVIQPPPQDIHSQCHKDKRGAMYKALAVGAVWGLAIGRILANVGWF